LRISAVTVTMKVPMRNDASVATDLGALLRDSLRESAPDEQELHGSGSVPVQLPTQGLGFRTASGVQPVVRDGLADLVEPGGGTERMPSLAPLPPVSTPVIPTPEKSGIQRKAEPATQKKSAFGLVLGIGAALAIVAGGGLGAAWYVKHHHSSPAPVAAAPVTPAAPEIAKLPVVAAAPVVEPAPPAEKGAEAPAAPVAEATPAADEAAAAPKKHHHHHATPTAKAADAPVAVAPKPAKADAPVAVAPKAEKPAPTPAAPPPKPAAPGGAVDAVLQQQLSGAIP
jgi:hypothetical protein